MNRAEYQSRLEQIGLDLQADNARIDATNLTHEERRKLHCAAEQKYVDASIALQRAMGIKTPVAMGRTD